MYLFHPGCTKWIDDSDDDSTRHWEGYVIFVFFFGQFFSGRFGVLNTHIIDSKQYERILHEVNYI